MVLKQILKQLIINYGVPIFKSFYKAYLQSVAKSAGTNKGAFDFKSFFKERMGGAAKDNPNDPFGKFFSEMMSKANLTQAPMTEQMALKILGLEASPSGKPIQPKLILQRYATLLDKNEASAGGSPYLQGKIITAKDFLMEKVPQAKTIEEEFLKQWKNKQGKSDQTDSNKQNKK